MMGISPVSKSSNNVHVRDCIPEQKGQPCHINLVRLLINFNLKEFLMTSTFSSIFFYATDYNNGPL